MKNTFKINTKKRNLIIAITAAIVAITAGIIIGTVIFNNNRPTTDVVENTTPSVEETVEVEETETQVDETPVVEETEAPEATPVETEEVEETTTPTTTPEATEEPESTPASTEEPTEPEPTEPPHTHNYRASVTQPTCTTQGYTTYTCNCGYSYKDNYTNGSHNYSNGTCTTCGASDPNYIPPHTHNYTGGDCSHPSTCSCGATGTYGSHKWTTKTWTEYIQHEAVDGYWCLQCGFKDVDPRVVAAHTDAAGHMAYGNCIVTPGWIETIEHNDTVCEICGAHQ